MAFDKEKYKNLDLENESNRLEDLSVEKRLEWLWNTFGEKAQIGTSFQGSGLVMMFLALKNNFNFPVFTIDTNLLFKETYELKAKIEEFFNIKIKSLLPEQTVEEQNHSMGYELWKTRPDTCCTMRKVLPLQRHLETIDVWMTGQRRQQSNERSSIKLLELYEYDKLRNQYIIKSNLMADWSREMVWDFIKKNKIPYNPLHNQGYRSIGCYPCTKKSTEGGDERSGRWTGFEKTECGIHTFLGDNI